MRFLLGAFSGCIEAFEAGHAQGKDLPLGKYLEKPYE